ncbi:MAG: hypothetical protein H8E48_08145 [Chloroflexi bacterium]|nr:hypothetical protein [Chloroflexota bacterium]
MYRNDTAGYLQKPSAMHDGGDFTMRPEVAEAMFRLKGRCDHPAGEKGCWHGPCSIRRRFQDGRLLIENPAGFLLAIGAEELESLSSRSKPRPR